MHLACLPPCMSSCPCRRPLSALWPSSPRPRQGEHHSNSSLSPCQAGEGVRGPSACPQRLSVLSPNQGCWQGSPTMESSERVTLSHRQHTAACGHVPCISAEGSKGGACGPGRTGKWPKVTQLGKYHIQHEEVGRPLQACAEEGAWSQEPAGGVSQLEEHAGVCKQAGLCPLSQGSHRTHPHPSPPGPGSRWAD